MHWVFQSTGGLIIPIARESIKFSILKVYWTIESQLSITFKLTFSCLKISCYPGTESKSYTNQTVFWKEFLRINVTWPYGKLNGLRSKLTTFRKSLIVQNFTHKKTNKKPRIHHLLLVFHYVFKYMLSNLKALCIDESLENIWVWVM